MNYARIEDDVDLRPGKQFPDDQLVYIYGRRFDLASIAWAMRAFIKNEERKKDYMPHWRTDPREMVLSFFMEGIGATDFEDFQRICQKYRLWS